MRFSLTGRGTVNAGGAVTVTLAGPPAWWRYDLSTVVCSVGLDSAGSRPTAAVYRGYIGQSQLLGTSRSADAVTFDASPGDVLLPGDSLIVVFANAAPGSTAVVNAFGEQVPIR